MKRRLLLVVELCIVTWAAFGACHAIAQTPGDGVTPATRTEAVSAADWSLKRPVQTATAQQERELGVVRQLARQRGGSPEALAQIIQLAGGFGDAASAELIEELAAAHFRAGDLNLAAQARTHLAERYPEEPLARQSLLWLVRLYSSSEVAHARRAESPGAAAIRRQLSPRMATALEDQPSADNAAAAGPSKFRRDSQLPLYALHLAERAMQQIPALAEEPAMAFQRAVAARRAGKLKPAQAYLSPLKHRGATDPWGQSARAEAWLDDPGDDAAPKPIIPCTSAAAPPHLDGILDDACWQRPPTRVRAPAEGRSDPLELRIAHDGEHLFIALECPALAAVAYEPDERPRPRDGNLEAHDRVRLLIDVDRDYASWFELVIDTRGWTAEGCWGDTSWNPEWFVARGASASGDTWTIEAAIPLAELTADEVGERTAWACFVERLPPTARQGEQVSSATPTPGPADFGVLLFE
jgi:hypothetical protein